MPKVEQRVITIDLTVTLENEGQTYSAENIVNSLIIKSADKKNVKVKAFYPADEQPA